MEPICGVLTEHELVAMERRADQSLCKLEREDYYGTWVEVQQPTYDVPALCTSHRILQDHLEQLMVVQTWRMKQLQADVKAGRLMTLKQAADKLGADGTEVIELAKARGIPLDTMVRFLSSEERPRGTGWAWTVFDPWPSEQAYDLPAKRSIADGKISPLAIIAFVLDSRE